MTNVQKKEIMSEKMEFNSKVSDPPMNFYLSSLEEQVRAQMEDSKAMITETESVGRVLLQIDEGRLQHFVDLLQEHKNGAKPLQLQIKGEEGSIQLERELAIERAQTRKLHIELTKLTEALNKQKEAANIFQEFHNIQMTDWKKETNSMAATLKTAQDQLQAERMKVDKEPLQNDMEAIRLKTLAKMNCIAKPKTNVELELESQLEIERAQTKKQRTELTKLKVAFKNQLEAGNKFLVFHNVQKTNWKKETNSMAATLKTAQDQLQAERMKVDNEAFQKEAEAIRLKTLAELNWIAKAKTNVELELESELEIERAQTKKQHIELTKLTESLKNQREEANTFQVFHNIQMKKQTNSMAATLKTTLHTQDMINQKLIASLEKKFEEQLQSEHLKWKQEKASMLENSNSLEVEKRKNDDLLAARTIEWEQERTSFKARLEKTCQDLEHAQMRNITALHTMEKEAVETLERNQAFQDQLEEQRAETNKITRALKETEDRLEKQSLSFQQLTLQLETSCVTKMKTQEEDPNNLLAALQKKFEDESRKWHQINSSLNETAEQSLEREKELLNDKTCLLSQLEELQQKITKKPKKKWYKLF
ncbi:uncharacterized protein ACO6RY_00604 [Pungitius sinensis]